MHDNQGRLEPERLTECVYLLLRSSELALPVKKSVRCVRPNLWYHTISNPRQPPRWTALRCTAPHVVFVSHQCSFGTIAPPLTLCVMYCAFNWLLRSPFRMAAGCAPNKLPKSPCPQCVVFGALRLQKCHQPAMRGEMRPSTWLLIRVRLCACEVGRM